MLPLPYARLHTKGPIRISLMHPTYHSLRTPDKVVFAASDDSQTITYARLEAESNQTAHLLRDLGLNQGDGIAILLDNDPRFLIVAWAAQRSGLYYTPISTFFQAAEVDYILSNADAKVLFTKRALFERLTLESSAHLTVILLDDDEPETWSELIKAYSPLPIADECEGAEMIYSSGTTGNPKACGLRSPDSLWAPFPNSFKSASIFIRWMPPVDIYRPRRSITQRRYATTCWCRA